MPIVPFKVTNNTTFSQIAAHFKDTSSGEELSFETSKDVYRSDKQMTSSSSPLTGQLQQRQALRNGAVDVIKSSIDREFGNGFGDRVFEHLGNGTKLNFANGVRQSDFAAIHNAIDEIRLDEPVAMQGLHGDQRQGPTSSVKARIEAFEKRSAGEGAEDQSIQSTKVVGNLFVSPSVQEELSPSGPIVNVAGGAPSVSTGPTQAHHGRGRSQVLTENPTPTVSRDAKKQRAEELGFGSWDEAEKVDRNLPKNAGEGTSGSSSDELDANSHVRSSSLKDWVTQRVFGGTKNEGVSGKPATEKKKITPEEGRKAAARLKKREQALQHDAISYLAPAGQQNALAKKGAESLLGFFAQHREILSDKQAWADPRMRSNADSFGSALALAALEAISVDPVTSEEHLDNLKYALNPCQDETFVLENAPIAQKANDENLKSLTKMVHDRFFAQGATLELNMLPEHRKKLEGFESKSGEERLELLKNVWIEALSVMHLDASNITGPLQNIS